MGENKNNYIKSESIFESERLYLSDVINVGDFKKGQANVIVAPCHTGKTTVIFEKIAPIASKADKVLVLIDTSAGKEALLTKEETEPYSEAWLENIYDDNADNGEWGTKRRLSRFYAPNGVRIMSYHQLGYKLEEHPDFFQNIEIVVCDEVHNLINYLNIERGKNKIKKKEGKDELETPCQKALNELARISKQSEDVPLVIIMSATINKPILAFDEIGVKLECFDYSDKVTQDKTHNRIYYSDIRPVLENLPLEERAVIFVPTIALMKEVAVFLDDGWRNVCCLWSINNEKHKMTNEQINVRNDLLKSHRIPSEIDVLIINAAYETSININNEEFRTLIVHSSNPDTQVQVRGRLRHDIDKLYLHDADHEHIADYFPEEYLDRFIPSSETKKIAKKMNLRDNKGNQRKWPSIARALEHDGFVTKKLKEKGERGWRISKSA